MLYLLDKMENLPDKKGVALLPLFLSDLASSFYRSSKMILSLSCCQFEVPLPYWKAKDTCYTREVIIKEEIKDSTN